MKQSEKDIELIELFTGDPDLANKIVWGEEYIKPLLREIMTRIMNIERIQNQIDTLPQDFIEAWKRDNPETTKKITYGIGEKP